MRITGGQFSAISFLACLLFNQLLVAANNPTTAPSIIPAPSKMTLTENASPGEIVPTTPITATDPALKDIARYLNRAIAPALGSELPLGEGRSPNAIILKLDPSLNLGDEGYRLVSDEQAITITARTPAGVFYGVQTLRQLLPPQIFSKTKVAGVRWLVPAVEIEDQPRFAWRGLMLDVCRHFFTKDEVKQFIDLMSIHKLNRFHWHLTDDQGWRIEIKKYPLLTQIGAWRNGIGFGLDPKATTAYGGDGRYGGFYTQDDIREVVAYAKDRFITVVPEIEMPGHATAAIAAYPELSCSGKKMEIETKGGVFPGVYCASNPNVDQFVTDVLIEVLELFPSQFVHVGGDEVPSEPWHACAKCQAYMNEHGLKNEHELESDFIARIDRFLSSRGRRLVGWDEILEGGLAPGATVMSWRGTSGGIAAAKARHDVIMSPGTHLYFDKYQADRKTQPLAIGGYTPLIKVHEFEPVPHELSADEAKHVLGPQANLWTEYVPNFRHVEYMAYPRACALAEVAWSPAEQRSQPGSWDDFSRRLRVHFARLDALDVNYFKQAIEQPARMPNSDTSSTKP